MKEEILRRCLRLFERNWRKLGVALVVLAVLALGVWVWPVPGFWNHLQKPDKAYYALRPSLITAGAALFAAMFLFWRNVIADKQLENAQLSRQEDRYKEGVELLANEIQVIRIGGLYVLHQLAEDSPKTWALPVLELMCAFVRMPPPDKDKAEGRSGERQLRRDVEEAVQLLGIRNSARREEEKREQEKAKKEGRGKSPGRGKLDFHGADLAGGSWEGVDLGGAYFRKTKLMGARFSRAILTEADFSLAALEGANLVGANITGANLLNAMLSSLIVLERTSFKGEEEERFNRVIGSTREQWEAGWIDEDRPPVKLEPEEEDGFPSPTIAELTREDWKRLRVDPEPDLRVLPPFIDQDSPPGLRVG